MFAPSMALQSWLRKQAEDSDPDLLREIVNAMAEAVMSADADVVCNAPYSGGSQGRDYNIRCLVKRLQRIDGRKVGLINSTQADRIFVDQEWGAG
jgi:hypothetical protein